MFPSSFGGHTTSGRGAISNSMNGAKIKINGDQTPKVPQQVGQSLTLPPLLNLDASDPWQSPQQQRQLP